MKPLIALLLILLGSMAIAPHSHAQLLNRIKRHIEDKVANKVNNAIDKTIDSAGKEDGNKQNPQSNGQNDTSTPSQSTTGTSQVPSVTAATSDPATLANYKNYDFVPGDKILFVSDFANQKDAELPSRLGTLQGTAEVQTYQGDKVLVLEKGANVTLIPLMKKKDYLPDQFTVEFDLLMATPELRQYNHLEIDFFQPNATRDNIKYPIQDSYYYKFQLDPTGFLDFGPNIDSKKLDAAMKKSLKTSGIWHHVAIYIHNNIGKAYIDQYRVAASNMMPEGVTKLSFATDGAAKYLIKNIRIAGGGSDAYQKIMTDGKLVTHGIHFDFGKSNILPESMGTINEMYGILKDHQDLQLEIDGYTDNVGSDESNLKLSQKRAEAVKTQLVKMGIDGNRLTTKGFGEQKPIAGNDSPEGRANNRRVEFVKK